MYTPNNPRILKGVVPPVCTPFTSDYQVDEVSLRRLINHLIDSGVHGLFILGSTSEVAYLTDKNRAEVIRITMDEVKGRVPVVVGAIDTTTLRVIEHVKTAVAAGVEGIVLQLPSMYVLTRQKSPAISDWLRKPARHPDLCVRHPDCRQWCEA